MAKKSKEERKVKGIYKRGSVYWIRYAGLDGKTVYESSRQGERTGTKQDAEFLLHKRHAAIGAGKQPEVKKKIPNVSFKTLSVDYLKWAKRQRAYEQKEILIRQLVEVFGNCPLRMFNTRLIEQYQTDRLQEGRKTIKIKVDNGYIEKHLPNKPATINRHVATIKHMFTKAVEWDMVEEETLKRIRKVKLLEENNRRLRYLAREECQALINASSKHLKPIVITALNTGMRRGEILSLRWENVDLKHGFILLDKTKNGERREIPINDTLLSTLEGLPRRLDGGYVFYDPSTDLPYGDIKNSFKGACKRAGIKDFHFHDLRHTFASHLVMAGIDIATVRELLGHKTLTMTLRYAHLAPSHKVKAVDILDNSLNESSDYTKTIQLRG